MCWPSRTGSISHRTTASSLTPVIDILDVAALSHRECLIPRVGSDQPRECHCLDFKLYSTNVRSTPEVRQRNEKTLCCCSNPSFFHYCIQYAPFSLLVQLQPGPCFTGILKMPNLRTAANRTPLVMGAVSII